MRYAKWTELEAGRHAPTLLSQPTDVTGLVLVVLVSIMLAFVVGA